MNPRRYTDDEVRELIDQLDTPMIAARGGRVCVTNEAYGKLLGLPRDQVEGRSYVDLVPPEERARIAEIGELKRAGKRVPPSRLKVIVPDASGRRILYDVHTQRLPAAAGEDYTLATMYPMSEEQLGIDFTEMLVETSAAAVAQRTLEDLRRSILESLAKGGLRASFFVRSGDDFVPLAGSAEVGRFQVACARTALLEGRTIFGGEGDLGPAQAYLPVRGEGFEPVVLLISGSAVDSRLASIFDLFAGLLAASFGNAAQHDVSSRRLSETEVLLGFSRTIASTLELSKILDVACDFLVELLDASNAFILLLDAEGRTLVGSAASAKHRAFFHSVAIAVDNPSSVAARVARERRPVTAGQETLKNQGMQDLMRRFGETAVVGLPLLARDELIGVVILDETRGPRQFSRAWMELAEATVSQIALSIANARLYESLRKSYEELGRTRAQMVRRERLAALGELSAVVAHEVRNPLAVIFNAVSSLRRLGPVPKEAQGLLDILSEESDRLNRMVNDLLDFARPRDLHLEPEDVGKVIQESIDAASGGPAGTQGVTFRAEVEPDLPRVQLDRRLMRQALVNVAVNAIQAMPRGGTVRVRAGRDEAKGREQVRIELTDEGPGIPPEIAQRIFEPFFTTKAQGTGLGLAVVKRILEEHDGEVEVSSSVGHGTTFTFRLPVTSAGAQA